MPGGTVVTRPFSFITACTAFLINVSFVIVDMTAVGAGVDTVTGMGIGVGVADPEPAGLITCKYPNLVHNDLC